MRVGIPAALVACVVLLGACAADGIPDTSEPDPNDPSASIAADDIQASESADDRRADVALDTMLRHDWNYGSRYFRDTHDYWIDAQAFDAILDGVQRTQGHRYARWIRAVYDGQNAIGWRRDFFDDENWMAMALIRAYDLTHDHTYLDRAADLFADIHDHAWHGHFGGVCWNRTCDSEATASNAGPVITGVRLYERRGDRAALAFARDVYDHWFETMVDHATGAVTDSIDRDGTRHHWHFTYNEGLVIGASVALYHATHDAHYLANAHLVASYLIERETVASPLGRVLDDHGTSCRDACEAFKGIAYRYLLALYDVDRSRSEYHDALSASARSLWNEARNPSTNLFGVSWTGPEANADATLAMDASATMALNLYAMLRADDRARSGECGVLATNETLVAGQTLASCSGRYRLVMQTDGNLVLYDHTTAIWASRTNGRGGQNAVMQSDGNVVVYDAAHAPLWASGSVGHAESILDVQDDGNLVVYAPGRTPTWASGTNGR